MSEWKKWIERYAREVARRLPRSRRDDVASELRSLLEDEVEEAIAARPEASPEEVAIERLRAHGPPAEVAHGYLLEPAALIGPRLYPTFRTVAAIVLGVYGLFTLAWVLGTETTTYVFPFRFRFVHDTSWMDVLAGALANLGIVVLIFAAIERWGRGDHPGEEWDPRTLPELPRTASASRFGHAVGAVVGLLILYALHYAPDALGMMIVRGNEWGPFPILDPNYRTFLPWLDAWLVAGIGLDLWLVARGRKAPAARAFDAFVDLFGAWVLWRIVSDGPFTVLDAVAKPVIGIVMVILVIAAASEAWRTVRDLRERRLSVPEVSSA